MSVLVGQMLSGTNNSVSNKFLERKKVIDHFRSFGMTTFHYSYENASRNFFLILII